jgi:endogenous inhibitor of DNA gyrase (YacG/DUF329 family)
MGPICSNVCAAVEFGRADDLVTIPAEPDELNIASSRFLMIIRLRTRMIVVVGLHSSLRDGMTRLTCQVADCGRWHSYSNRCETDGSIEKRVP